MNRRSGRIDLAAYAAELQDRNRRRECFICDIAQDPSRHQHVVYEDEVAVAFLPRHLTMPGRVILAPRDHRTEVVDDFPEVDYLEIQRRVHRLGRAISSAFEPERIYVFSFGAQQGVDHVHWHIAGLPPGVPFEEQQFNAVMLEKGHLELDDSEKDWICSKIRAALA